MTTMFIVAIRFSGRLPEKFIALKAGHFLAIISK